MTNKLKISTWNLCLGLSNKEDVVTDTLKRNNIGICALQETKIPMNFPEGEPNCNGYNLELETNSEKKRANFYIRNDITYVRRKDLEKENSHLLVIDVTAKKPICIINIYRSFRPPGMVSPSTFFNTQLELLVGSLTGDTYALGDFNLDAKMELRRDYAYKN